MRHTFDWFEEITSGFEAGIGAVVAFRGETHGGAVGAAGVGCFVVAWAHVRYRASLDGWYGTLTSHCSAMLASLSRVRNCHRHSRLSPLVASQSHCILSGSPPS